MPRLRAFTQVDVFTAVPFKGNPVAVVLDGSGLTDAEMQAFANWTNLSETTFVLPPTDPAADYALRIFTPKDELPFAGHPTLGSAHAVVHAGLAKPKAGRLVQQCAVGLVDLAVDEAGIAFRLPRYAQTPVKDPEAVAWLGEGVRVAGTPQAVDVGPVWLIAELAERSALENLAHDPARLTRFYQATGMTGATIFARDGDGIMVRSFAPGDGIPEDPVCGSGNAAVAAYRLGQGQIGAGSRYIASQGRQIGRDGSISVRIEGDSIHVGGACVTCIEGTVLL
ncbi:PhzF family phenazine biosynthesis protein [Novosphingobium kunmingense]|uniref:PhzF family phenazine biosynthesis protein n=1 Tax=Novosphingobium kunmingense TaxID=1211806 RepID=A0A2N0I1J8_9SPHN|nr:PhzF family phenazine biosynthesis protein [Novosphingobium kunmingense]PKB25046.1 PhzF family phenazine biosynthesis protein [Novosphingobium kunmingense]